MQVGLSPPRKLNNGGAKPSVSAHHPCNFSFQYQTASRHFTSKKRKRKKKVSADNGFSLHFLLLKKSVCSVARYHSGELRVQIYLEFLFNAITLLSYKNQPNATQSWNHCSWTTCNAPWRQIILNRLKNLTVILSSLVSVSPSVKSVGMQRAPSRTFCSMVTAHVRYCLGDNFPIRGFSLLLADLWACL